MFFFFNDKPFKDFPTFRGKKIWILNYSFQSKKLCNFSPFLLLWILSSHSHFSLIFIFTEKPSPAPKLSQVSLLLSLKHALCFSCVVFIINLADIFSYLTACLLIIFPFTLCALWKPSLCLLLTTVYPVPNTIPIVQMKKWISLIQIWKLTSKFSLY